MENLTGGTPPVRYLPCVVPCKLYFTNLEALTGVADQPGFQGIWAIFKAGGQECGRVFIPEDQLHGGTVRVVLDSSGSVVSEAAAS